jgi:ribulose-5-phosphate 4-epimerase/fuculose-1-phosphate aldolase
MTSDPASGKPAVSDTPWPRAMPGIGRTLTVRQELACMLRILAQAGWQENLSGHITWVASPDDIAAVTGMSVDAAASAHPGAMWVNPWGMWWEEVSASDIVLVSPDGGFLHGRWDVTPAVFIHTELHRARPDAAIVVHNHPYHATLLANLGELPEIVHQNSILFWDELVMVDEYAGVVEDATAGAALADAIGAASAALLRNHGAIVTGSSPGEACYKAVTLERMCRFHVDALATGRKPRPIDGSSTPAARDAVAAVKALLQRNTPDAFWHGAVRRLLRREPDVLD